MKNIRQNFFYKTFDVLNIMLGLKSMKRYQVATSFLLGLLGWVSVVVHTIVKDRLINELGEGSPDTISQAQSYAIFFSLLISMVACASIGFWLLLNSKQEINPCMRALAWPLHISYCIILAFVWLVAGAEP